MFAGILNTNHVLQKKKNYVLCISPSGIQFLKSIPALLIIINLKSSKNFYEVKFANVCGFNNTKGK